MRIKQIQIDNFRCIDHAAIGFDEVTTLIGPNGVGKSSVLRALDWFFNGPRSGSLTDEDVYAGAQEKKISVRVDFDMLTETDREELDTKYAPPGTEVFTAWRTWENGAEKLTGKALAFQPFEEVRAGTSATQRRQLYAAVTADYPDMALPRWTNDAATLTALDQWERDHPELLSESEVSYTNLFGFAGQGRLSRLFEYVLVTADLRASEESQDSKASVIGHILEKTVDRTAANTAFLELSSEVAEKHEQINADHILPQLEVLSGELSREVGAFTFGREVRVTPLPTDYKPPAVKFTVKVRDHLAETDVERQGHGFQRALLIGALKLLASRGSRPGGERVIFLAIEEPELFQHPTQCKAFAKVLRELASEDATALQVAYATHSPYFIEPRFFDQIRRVHRSAPGADEHHRVAISHASMDDVCGRLAGYESADAVRRRLDSACTHKLAEAVFAQAVVLVEGTDDQGVIEGTAGRDRHLSVDGIAVADCNGKTGIFLNHAILTALGIPCYVIFDGDKGCGQRMIAKGQQKKEIDDAERKNKAENRRLLRYLGEAEADWPDLIAGTALTVFPDNLETFLAEEWPAWGESREALMASGMGFEGKNAATYSISAKQAASNPPDLLEQVITRIRDLVD